MKLELQSASNFLVHLVKLSSRISVAEDQLVKFRDSLVEVLRRRYRDHWFPEKPFKGSGYRCIRINGRMDPVIAQAGEACGLDPSVIHATFPSELTMWIDPLEVSYRIGENGSICVLYEYKEDGPNDPWRPNQNAKSSSSSSSNNDNANVNAKNQQQQQKQQQQQQQNQQQQQQQALNDNNCKETLRKMDYLLDPRKSVSIEQLAAYVSSS
jgi:protein Tob/BTG